MRRLRSLRRCAWIRSCWACLRPSQQKRLRLPPRKSRARRCVRPKRPPSRFGLLRHRQSVLRGRCQRTRPGQRPLPRVPPRSRRSQRLTGMFRANSPRRRWNGLSPQGGLRVCRASPCRNRFVKCLRLPSLQHRRRRRPCERQCKPKLFRHHRNRSRLRQAWSNRLPLRSLRLGAMCRRSSPRRRSCGLPPCRRRLRWRCRRRRVRHNLRLSVVLNLLSRWRCRSPYRRLRRRLRWLRQPRLRQLRLHVSNRLPLPRRRQPMPQSRVLQRRHWRRCASIRRCLVLRPPSWLRLWCAQQWLARQPP